MVWVITTLAVIFLVTALAYLFRKKGFKLFKTVEKKEDIDAAIRETTPYLDENVQFTVYRPRTIQPLKWYPLLAFVHLSERRSDMAMDEPDPIEEVQKQARQVLGTRFGTYQDLMQESSQPVPREGPLTFIPEIPGIEFNPPYRAFFWKETVHREEFRLRASPELDGKTARGRFSVFLGRILLAEINLNIKVDSHEEIYEDLISSFEKFSAPVYRKIFASYSHKDVMIVEEFENYARALGDEYLRDLVHLRAGEVWDEQIRQLVDQAQIFQLFWSWNSIRSEFVEKEWRYALSLSRPFFIRPVYWEEPLPELPEKGIPPEELRRFHFQRIYPVPKLVHISDVGMPLGKTIGRPSLRNPRIIIVFGLLTLFFSIITFRAFQLQTLLRHQLYKLAAQQHLVQIPFVPKRGTIYDRKENELAVSIEVDSVYADPPKVVDVDRAAHDLAHILQVDREELRRRLKSHRSFEWIARKISLKQAEKIKALGLPGIHFLKESQRFYLNGKLASHVIGFVGMDNHGLEGVEFQYDKYLIPQDEKDMSNKMPSSKEDKKLKWNNIILTIDGVLQSIVERELDNAISNWEAADASAIIMDAFTGEILALANRPTFDPNRFIDSRSRNWRNGAITNCYEPGSLFKIVVGVGALEKRLAQGETGSLKEIIERSSNVGFNVIVKILGKEGLYKYAKLLGFGEKTDVDLPGEASCRIEPPTRWSNATVDKLAEGKEISVTPIQLIRAYSALANGGLLVSPHVVSEITSSSGKVLATSLDSKKKRIMSQKTAETLKGILKGDDYGIKNSVGFFGEEKSMGSFVGLIPGDNPRLALVVVIHVTKEGTFDGGRIAVMVSGNIVREILSYMNIPRE